LITTDLDGKIYTFNATAVEITRHEAENMRGKSIFSLFGDIELPIADSLNATDVGGFDLVFSIWGAIYLVFLELVILTAVAILFSSFSSPSLSALLTFFVFIIGHFSASLRDFAESLGSSAARIFFNFLYYVLPNLSFYEFRTNSAHGDFPPFTMLGGATLYALFYISILLAVTILIFSRRNFK